MVKSCDDCSYKLKDKKESKYAKHNIYCNRRKCIIPSPEEAIWCEHWNEMRIKEGEIKNVI